MIDRTCIGLIAAAVGWAAVLGGCSDKGDQAMFTLQSPAFDAGSPIPARHTADGADASPPLQWFGVPAGTRGFALIVEDPDAPTATPWVHWIIYQIAADRVGLPEGIEQGPTPPIPVLSRQGANSWTEIGYRGPAPPAGSGVHHYHFRLYALDNGLPHSPGLDKADLLHAMAGHILAEAELIGTYQR